MSPSKNPNDQKNDLNKGPSVWGLLFNPRFGKDIAPLKDSFFMFARIIASLFAMVGLFPRDHAAFVNNDVTLSLREVMGTAYANLRFTKEGIPQILYFVAVVGCLAFSLLFVLTLLFSFLVPEAHAQIFQAPSQPGYTDNAGGCDLAQLWLGYLFLGLDINAAQACGYTVTGSGGAATLVPNGNDIQVAVGDALRFFSNGVLVLAGIILLYHLVVMVIDTAHTARFMGKANQVWAPLRLIFAIGLLVPIAISGSGVTGLNTGQYIAIQMARWGSGFASNAWARLLDGYSDHLNAQSIRMPPPPFTDDFVRQALIFNACRLVYNQYVTTQELPDAYRVNIQVQNPTDTQRGQINFVSGNGLVRCGTITYANPTTTGGQASLSQLNATVRNAVWTEITNLVSDSNTLFTDTSRAALLYMDEGYTEGTDYLRNNQTVIANVNTLIANFADSVNQAISSNLGAADMEGVRQLQGIMQTISTQWGNQGWVMAGAWYNTIANAQTRLFQIVNGAFDTMYSSGKLEYSAWADTAGQDSGYRSIDEDVTRVVGNYGALIQQANARSPQELAALGMDPLTNSTLNGLMGAFLNAVDWIAVKMNVWDEGNQLAFVFGNTVNPMSELVSFGAKLLALGLDILSYAIGGSALGSLGGATLAGVSLAVANPALGAVGAMAALTLGDVIRAMAGLGITLGAILIGAGIMLAYVLPLMPFIRFFFHVITWLLTVFESVVAMPILALAHVTPYGEGLPGQMAQRGYFMILSIFLRPILTVIGLIAGFLLFFVAIYFLNISFTVAISGIGSFPSSFDVLSKIIFSVMYVVLAYICANNCFKTIGYFAEQAMNWMNAAAALGVGMGDRGVMNTAIGATTTFMGTKVGETLKGAGDSVGKRAETFIGAPGKK
jgi:conjugal transfer/type IV secretion protein DotA/TraY